MCGRVAVHSQAVKIDVITEKILEMNTRGDSRIKKEKEEPEENKCNNFSYFRIYRQSQDGATIPEELEESDWRSTVDTISVLIYYKHLVPFSI